MSPGLCQCFDQGHLVRPCFLSMAFVCSLSYKLKAKLCAMSDGQTLSLRLLATKITIEAHVPRQETHPSVPVRTGLSGCAMLAGLN